MKLLRLTDEQEARALELESVGEFERAKRVRLCGTERFGFGKKTCKQRCCPRCARAHATANASKIKAALALMPRPVLVLFTLRSRGRDDLSEAIDRFRRYLAVVWKQTCLASVRSGIGCLETAVTRDARAYLVHAHMALDIEGSLAVNAVAEAWARLTSHTDEEGNATVCGMFGIDGPVRSASALAEYASKCDTWSPPPGELDLDALETVLGATAGRRLVIVWSRQPRPQRPVVVRQLREQYEERAAHHEFDGGLPREEAERVAAVWARREWMTQLAARRWSN